MTDEGIRKTAKAYAEDCRRKDRLCVFLERGSIVTYKDCPMRPHKCWHVSAKMWEQALRDVFQSLGELEEGDDADAD